MIASCEYIQYTRFEKLATMGRKAFSSSALYYSLYIHPRTDYHTDSRMSLPRVNYILHRRMDRSEPWPTYRALWELERFPILYESIQLESVIRSSFNYYMERSSRRFLFNHLEDFPQSVRSTCQSNWYVYIFSHSNTIRSSRYNAKEWPILIYLDSRIRLFEGTFAALVPLRRSHL